MKTIFSHSPQETAAMDTAALRAAYLLQNLMEPGILQLSYTFEDRLIVGGAVPLSVALGLPNPDGLKASHFLERRELGIINVGGSGWVEADGKQFTLHKLDALYLGMGAQGVQFGSVDAGDPALFYLLSAPAHTAYPSAACTRNQAMPVAMGSSETSNQRTIYKYIHADGITSCQLVMGLTLLDAGSVWNSIPPHTHTRRSEVYFYFDLPGTQRIFHFMGEPQQTRHLVVANHQAVLSPPWSTHFGCGTSNYGFIWGMAGENLTYTDMDPAPVSSLL